MRKPKITITDIARDCGVGLGTVSRVINDQPGVKDEIRRKIRQYIEDVGYHSHGLQARFNLRADREAVALVASTALLERKYDLDPVRMLIERLAVLGRAPLALFGSIRENLERVRALRPVGVVAIGPQAAHGDALRRLRDQGIRCVCLGDTEVEGVDQVVPSCEKAAFRLTRHWLGRGLTRIGFFGGLGEHRRYARLDDIAQPRVRDMLRGVLRAHPGFRLEHDVVSDAFDALGALRNALDARRHQAWICGDEKSCRQFLYCADALGLRIPDDVALSSFAPDLPRFSIVPAIPQCIPDNKKTVDAVLGCLFDGTAKKPRRIAVDCRFLAGGTKGKDSSGRLVRWPQDPCEDR